MDEVLKISVEVRLALLEITLKELRADGLLDETAIRNYKIRQHHALLMETGMHNNKAIEYLSDRYCLGDKSIEKIIYRNN